MPLHRFSRRRATGSNPKSGAVERKDARIFPKRDKKEGRQPCVSRRPRKKKNAARLDQISWYDRPLRSITRCSEREGGNGLASGGPLNSTGLPRYATFFVGILSFPGAGIRPCSVLYGLRNKNVKRKGKLQKNTHRPKREIK